MAGCLLAIFIIIVMPFILVVTAVYRNIRTLTDKYKQESQQKEDKKKDNWQKPNESSESHHDSRKIIQDDEGEYIDFEEV